MKTTLKSAFFALSVLALTSACSSSKTTEESKTTLSGDSASTTTMTTDSASSTMSTTTSTSTTPDSTTK